MNSRKNHELKDHELEAMLAETFGPPPPADTAAWRQRHPGALAWLDPRRISIVATRSIRMKRYTILAATAAAAICVWLGIGVVNTPIADRGNVAFGQIAQQIEKARTITWKWTVYEHITSKDGERTWLKTDTREKAYKAPGLYRDVFFDEKGQVRQIEITDSVHEKQLRVFPMRKEAVLSEPRVWQDPAGPFDWVKKELRDSHLQWVGTRETASGKVNVFRHALRDEPNGRDWSYDFWIAQDDKRIVEVRVPGADIYDPDNDPASKTPPEKEMSAGALPGSRHHDIVFDADVDDSLFRLEPPTGYTVKTEATPRRQVTEKEMVDYLGILADFNGKTFPDQVFPFDISSDRTNKARHKPKSKQTAAEQKLIEVQDRYTPKFHQMPPAIFVEDRAVEGTFRYLGKGVKLGERDRIVCWYKLKDAKDPSAYRVVYGDLSVKDVDAKDLPLPVDP